MKPTPEQVEAAKAYTLDRDTREQAMLLREENRIVPVERTVSRILLAALEAAEEDSARLDYMEMKQLNDGPCLFTEGFGIRAAIDDSMKKDAARKAQP